MASTFSKTAEVILKKCADHGYAVERSSSSSELKATITAPEGATFIMDITSSGLNRVRPVLDQPNGRSIKPAIFNDNLNGRREKNVLAEMARFGLDIRDHPKKKARQKAEEAEAASDAESAPLEGDPMAATAVQEILDNLPSVNQLLHQEVLRLAREAGSRQDEIDGKFYLYWDGDVTAILAEVYDDLSEEPIERLALLDKELPSFCRRQGKLERIHKGGPGEEDVWRVLDDGHEFAPIAAAEPVAPAARVEEEMTAPKETPAPARTVATPPGEDSEEVVTVFGKRRVLYKCGRCAFTDFTAQARVMHNTQSGDHHSPVALACPECKVIVKNSGLALDKHMRKEHGAGNLCISCADNNGEALWFRDATGYNWHLDTAHPGERRRRAKAPKEPIAETLPEPVAEPEPKPDRPDIAQEMPPAAEPTPAPGPAPQPSSSVLERSEALSGPVVTAPVDKATEEAVVAVVTKMFADYPRLQEENAQLRKELEEERELRQNAEGKLAAVIQAQEALSRALGR